MKKQLIHFLMLMLLSLGVISCKKDYGDNSLSPLEDSVADIPVTVANQEFFERYAIVTAPYNNGAGTFKIVLEIPANKGKIKEISRITVGTSGLAYLGIDASAYNYNATTKTLTPIAGNGSNQITFTSDLATYTAFTKRVGNTVTGLVPATVATDPTNPNQLQFYFVLTLEDGQQLVSPAVRVRVVS
ncbi:hypothetical protein [Hymenobacter jejuensis]|uniref:DUF1735 domain-containing protein n=1 Tax=Hymenobacter jejuensis TaxID=2502781 RepID=A0A5B8A3X3_9BACT|nr:hypothetical protein [Hymenobacter jejuensis]QDA62074.1 hypothetical protein FHG12_19080 [Hymenobacter jejuensis]